MDRASQEARSRLWSRSGRPLTVGIRVKTGVAAVLAATLAVAAAPAPVRAQEMFPSFVLARICVPYATRAQTFEEAIRTARGMEFRRPAGETGPIEEWASDIEMVSKDGTWRLRIEEGTVTRGEVDVYEVTCGLSSTRASARELSQAARLALRASPLWAPGEGEGHWDRRTSDPEFYTVRVDVTEEPGRRPVLTATGSYY